MRLTDDQRATIIENDEKACEQLHQLFEQLKLGQVTQSRAMRLRANIEGRAIERWRNLCKKEDAPISDLLRDLELITV